jgi:hypothetical protein
MQLRRFVGFVDIGIAVMVLVALLLPAREMFASTAYKASEADQFALALAEARTLAHPDDGAAIDQLSRKLGAAGFKDWAIEAALRGSERAKASPTRWRALLATSVAFTDRIDVVPALDYVNRAVSACEDHRPACPTWEQVRMEQYQRHLDAGVKSGIDPRRGPAAAKAFRQAGEAGLRQIYVGGHTGERPVTPPEASATGSGSATR